MPAKKFMGIKVRVARRVTHWCWLCEKLIELKQSYKAATVLHHGHRWHTLICCQSHADEEIKYMI